MLLGDKDFTVEVLAQELKSEDIDLETPKRNNMKENRSNYFLGFLHAKRKIIEVVISQLSRIFNIQNFRTKDLWHFTNRITRKILAHNICTMINLRNNDNALAIEPLVT